MDRFAVAVSLRANIDTGSMKDLLQNVTKLTIKYQLDSAIGGGEQSSSCL